MTVGVGWYLDREVEFYERELVAVRDTLDALVELRGSNRYQLDKFADRETKRRPIKHGTDGGYVAHLRRDEPVCDACAAAHAARRRDNKSARGRTSEANSELVMCPHCGRKMRRGGYIAHRRRLHSASNAEPVRVDLLDGVRIPDAPCPATRAATVDGYDFACDSCDEQYAKIANLIAHIIGVHRRSPTRAERTPRRAVS